MDIYIYNIYIYTPGNPCVMFFCFFLFSLMSTRLGPPKNEHTVIYGFVSTNLLTKIQAAYGTIRPPASQK